MTFPSIRGEYVVAQVKMLAIEPIPNKHNSQSIDSDWIDLVIAVQCIIHIAWKNELVYVVTLLIIFV